MQIFKMLINSLPYKFQNVVFIGDFPKSTIHAAATLNADQKVLCNLNSALEINGISQQPFPIVDSFTNLQNYQNANLKGFSSLKAPAAIKQLLPGIIFDQTPLQCQPLDNLIQNLNIPEGSANLAVLNLNGAEHEYLVESEILLNTFSCVLISCSSSNIFEGAAESYEKLLAHFEAQNIAYSVFPAEVHPFSFILIHRMPNWKAYAKTLEIVEAKSRGKDNDINEALQNIDSLKSELSLFKSENEHLDRELSSSRALLSKLEKDHDSERKKLENEVERQKQWHLDNKNWAESLKITNDKLNNDLKEFKVQLEKCNSEIVHLQSSLGILEKEKNHAEQNSERIQKLADLNARLLTKSNVDLDDLRQQIKEKNEKIAELTSLIARLHAKLKQAAYYYEQLQQQHPDLGLESL